MAHQTRKPTPQEAEAVLAQMFGYFDAEAPREATEAEDYPDAGDWLSLAA